MDGAKAKSLTVHMKAGTKMTLLDTHWLWATSNNTELNFGVRCKDVTTLEEPLARGPGYGGGFQDEEALQAQTQWTTWRDNPIPADQETVFERWSSVLATLESELPCSRAKDCQSNSLPGHPKFWGNPSPARATAHTHGAKQHLDASAHNYKVPLLRLPMELICEIAAPLKNLDKMAMQRVCRRLRQDLMAEDPAPGWAVAPQIRNALLSGGEVLGLGFMLRFDRQVRLQAQWERLCDLASSFSVPHKLHCSGCRTLHSIEYFSDRQRRATAKTRLCKGLEGTVRLCEHQSFSGLCLLKGQRELGGNSLIWCNDHAHGRGTDDEGEDLDYVEFWPTLSFVGGHAITIDRAVRLFTLEYGKIAKHSQLRLALNKANVYICPHLRSNDPSLFGGKPFTADCPAINWTTVPEGQPQRYPCRDEPECVSLRRGSCVVWSKCHVQDCPMRYCFRRVGTKDYDLDIIIFEMSSDLVGGPANPSWLALTHEAGQTGTQTTCARDREILGDKCSKECCLAPRDRFMATPRCSGDEGDE